MPFPETKYGKCEKCGHGGIEESSGSAERGYYLEYYDGKWLGPVCLAEAKDRRQDRLKREQDIDGQRFRDSVGFTKP